MYSEYSIGSSPVHKADPGIKVYLIIFYILISLLSWRVIPAAICVLMAVMSLMISGVPFEKVLRRRTLYFAAAFVISAVLIIFAPIQICLMTFLRLSGAAVFADTLLITSDPEMLLLGIRRRLRLSPSGSAGMTRLLLSGNIREEELRRLRDKKAMIGRDHKNSRPVIRFLHDLKGLPDLMRSTGRRSGWDTLAGIRLFDTDSRIFEAAVDSPGRAEIYLAVPVIILSLLSILFQFIIRII